MENSAVLTHWRLELKHRSKHGDAIWKAFQLSDTKWTEVNWLRPDSTCHRTTDAASKSDSNTRRCTRQLLTPHPWVLCISLSYSMFRFFIGISESTSLALTTKVLENNEIISVDNICLFKHFQRTNPSHIFVVDFSRILPFCIPFHL